MKKLLTILFLLTLSVITFGESKQFDSIVHHGSNKSEYIYDIVVDTFGNKYITGKFYATLDFGNGVTITPVNSYDGYVVKFDADDNALWAQSFGGVSADEGNALAVDADGNVIVSGVFFKTIVFGTDTLKCTGNFDIAIIKFDADGNYQWMKQAYSYSGKQEKGKDIKIDSQGNYILTCYGADNAIDTLYYEGIEIESLGERDVFIIKMDSDGNPIWCVNGGGADNEEPKAMILDKDDNIYVTGMYKSTTATFGTHTINNEGGSDIFLIKLNSSGQFQFATSSGGHGDDIGYAIEVIIKEGDSQPAENILLKGRAGNSSAPMVLLAGAFSDTLDLSPEIRIISAGSKDMCVLAYDGNTGVANIALSFGGVGTDEAKAINFLPETEGYWYLSGISQGDMVVGSDSLFNKGKRDMVVIHMMQENVDWAENYGGNSDDYLNATALGKNGNIYFAGNFKSSPAAFPPFNLNSNGKYDLWIGKMHEQSTSVTFICDLSQQITDGIFNPATDSVFVIGDFQTDAGDNANWQSGMFKLQRHDETSPYYTQIGMPSDSVGKMYEFKFVMNDSVETITNRSFVLEYPNTRNDGQFGRSNVVIPPVVVSPPVGSGTEANPYQIATIGNLVWLAKTDSVWDDGAYFIQTANIDASATDTMVIGGFNPGWSPIGNVATSFTGSYDGAGYTIDGLVSHGNNANMALFGTVEGEIVIKNLGLTNINMTTGGSSGALLGVATGNVVVKNCYSTGYLEAQGSIVGGLIGGIQSGSQVSITDCFSSVTVHNLGAADYTFTGGFVGFVNGVNGIIANCYSEGDVIGNTDADGKLFTGGFVGLVDGNSETRVLITNCHSTGDVTGSLIRNGFSPAGGFAATVYHNNTVTKCYATGNVKNGGADTGGFVGYTKYGGVFVSNCYSLGSVTRTATSTQPQFGSFCGRNRQGAYIEKSYSIGSVTFEGVDNPTGNGFIGDVTGAKDTLCFFDKEVSLQESTAGSAVAKTTLEMQTDSTFIKAGWDFASVWEIAPNNYPTLQAYVPDTEAPTPNPMTFAVRPHATQGNELFMIASVATDAGGMVRYLFECSNDATKSSGLQASNEYVAVGLQPDSVYTFTVRAIDLSGNATTASDEVYGRTLDNLFYTENNGICVIEAERATVSINADSSGWASPFDAPIAWFEETTDSGFVGTGYMTTDDGVALNTTWELGTELSWDVYITTPGEYFVAARQISKTGGDDSAYLGVDSIQIGDRVFAQIFTEFAWRNASGGLSIGTLDEGMHTIQIRRREDGFMLDRLMIANDVNALPANASTEAGPDESVRADSVVSVERNGKGNIPTVFALEQNYPNPFNPTTVIEFALPKQSDVKLAIYNILGEKVAELVNSAMVAGYHSVDFNATNLASGMYIYRIQAGNFVSVKKMMLLK